MNHGKKSMIRIELKKVILIIFIVGSFCQAALALPGHVVKPAVEDKVEFAFEPADFQKTTYGDSWIHDRMQINVEKRLLTLDLDLLLEPFKQRPGVQWWVGEHIGKFLHAASYAYRFTDDERLKKRMRYAVKELLSTQLPNGYLGTYEEKDQFYQGDGEDWRGPIWDVWMHKYNLIGLLSYYQATGDSSALKASRRAADLLYDTFVVQKKSFRRASAHVGMAATSVLEPMATLYRFTGEQRYLDFCHYIIESWDQRDDPSTEAKEQGSGILKSLLDHGRVFDTANKKAYEMTSNLVGLLELYRVDPDDRYLIACKRAWDDIATKRLYITGTASYNEHFDEDHSLRPGRECAEGCVTVTWLQLTTHLLELTGDLKYADALERTLYNALTGAESPFDGEVTYYTPLIGYKGFGESSHDPSLPGISCCSSSVPRGIAMIPEFASGSLNGRPALLQYIPGTHALHYGKGTGRINVDLVVRGSYPDSGDLEIEVKPEKVMQFPLVLRVPAWSKGYEASVAGETYTASAKRLIEIDRKWSPGDTIQVSIPLAIRLVPDTDKSSNMVAFARGPQVLAADESVKAAGGIPEEGWWDETVLYNCAVRQWDYQKVILLVPFADVGQTKADYTALHYGVESLEGGARTVDISAAVQAFAPGWSVRNCLDDSNPGLNAEVRGKKNVLVTHPLNEAAGCELYGTVTVPEGQSTLRLVVGHHEEGDWTLLVKANGAFLLETTIGPEASVDGWMQVDVNLSKFAGGETSLSLYNLANGWHDEAGYWASIEMATD
ncbi:MAG: glycoside hydrolase family 127 protein [Planctomycetota bacterium]|jgi:DUF1680 family protein